MCWYGEMHVPSADDFLNFYNDSRTLFAGDMKNVK